MVERRQARDEESKVFVLVLASNRLLLKGKQNQRATRPKTKEEK